MLYKLRFYMLWSTDLKGTYLEIIYFNPSILRVNEILWCDYLNQTSSTWVVRKIKLSFQGFVTGHDAEYANQVIQGLGQGCPSWVNFNFAWKRNSIPTAVWLLYLISH